VSKVSPVQVVGDLLTQVPTPSAEPGSEGAAP
jgi:hypothetical protein